jgi:hypothetical protein
MNRSTAPRPRWFLVVLILVRRRRPAPAKHATRQRRGPRRAAPGRQASVSTSRTGAEAAAPAQASPTWQVPSLQAPEDVPQPALPPSRIKRPGAGRNRRQRPSGLILSTRSAASRRGGRLRLTAEVPPYPRAVGGACEAEHLAWQHLPPSLVKNFAEAPNRWRRGPARDPDIEDLAVASPVPRRRYLSGESTSSLAPRAAELQPRYAWSLAVEARAGNRGWGLSPA